MTSVHEFIGVKQIGQNFFTENLKSIREISAALKKILGQHTQTKLPVL